MNINDIKTVKANPVNYNPAVRSFNTIRFIVVHYTGNKGDTAMNNCKYYQTAEVKTSAHYFIDKNEILCSVPINHTAYAVGGSQYPSCSETGGGSLNSICRNSNSVSIEICGKIGSYAPDTEALDQAVWLTYQLMKLLNIPPSNVIRHFDVTGKLCPGWAIPSNPTPRTNVSPMWTKFIKEVIEMYTAEEYTKFKEMMARYNKELAEKDTGASAWYADVMKWASDTKVATGGRPESIPNRAEVLTMIRRSHEL